MAKLQNIHIHNIAKTMGHNLRELRRHKGLTQKEIALELRVSFQQIQKYEKGINRLPVEHLLSLRQLYGVPFEAFFDGIKIIDQTHNNESFIQNIDSEQIMARLQNHNDNDQKMVIFRVIDLLMSHTMKQ